MNLCEFETVIPLVFLKHRWKSFAQFEEMFVIMREHFKIFFFKSIQNIKYFMRINNTISLMIQLQVIHRKSLTALKKIHKMSGSLLML